MDIIRRNTDYAMRVMVHLASLKKNKLASAKELSQKEDISYQLACKLLQRLGRAGVVKSVMGSKGGFRLSRIPAEINMLEIVGAIQGKVSLNRCVGDKNSCSRYKNCSVHKKLWPLQQQMEDYLGAITLSELVNGK